MYKTRIEKWSKYRNVIYNNIELHQEIIASNEKLFMLYNRLLKVFPKYKKIFDTHKEVKIKFNEINEPNKYNFEDIVKLIDQLNQSDKENINLKYLNDIKFSTGELETIINDLESWKPNGSMINSYKKISKNIEFKKMEKVKI